MSWQVRRFYSTQTLLSTAKVTTAESKQYLALNSLSPNLDL